MDCDNLERLTLPVQYTIDPDFSSDKFIKMRLAICHTGKNLNQTSFTRKEYDAAASSLPYSPILAYVEFDEDGEPQFQGHAAHTVETEDGERIIYDEQPIGVVPENCNYKMEQVDGKDFVCADAYIWRKYANYALDIIERDEKIPLSMEIDIKDYTYSKSGDVYTILDFEYLGISFCDDPARVAMQGACAVPVKNYSVKSNDFFTMLKNELREELTKYEKGGTSLDTNTTSVPVDGNEQPEAGTPAVGDVQGNQESDNQDFEEQTPEVKTSDSTENTPAPENNEGNESGQDAENTSGNSNESSESSGDSSDASGTYGLNSNLIQSVREAIAGLDMKYEWFEGYFTDKYDFEDIDPQSQKVYMLSWEDMQVYGVNYSMAGDKVVLGSNFVRQVREYRDYVDGIQTAPSTAFESVSGVRKNFTAKIETLQNEVKEFEQYKQSVEAEKKIAEVAELFEKFTDLAGIEEYESLKVDTQNNLQNYEIASLETQLYAIRGKQVKVDYTVSGQSGRLILPKTGGSRDFPVSGSRAVLEHFIPKKG